MSAVHEEAHPLLLDTVLVDAPASGAFGARPELTRGCVDIDRCLVVSPDRIGQVFTPGGLQQVYFATGVSNGRLLTDPTTGQPLPNDLVLAVGVPDGLAPTLDLGADPGRTFVRWTLASVPEPPLLGMLFSGLLLMLIRRLV